MKSPNKAVTILTDYAVDLMFEIYLMRGDCSQAAQGLLGQSQVDEASVEDCARLDEALAKAYRSLRQTVERVRRSQARRSKLNG